MMMLASTCHATVRHWNNSLIWSLYCGLYSFAMFRTDIIVLFDVCGMVWHIDNNFGHHSGHDLLWTHEIYTKFLPLWWWILLLIKVQTMLNQWLFVNFTVNQTFFLTTCIGVSITFSILRGCLWCNRLPYCKVKRKQKS